MAGCFGIGKAPGRIPEIVSDHAKMGRFFRRSQRWQEPLDFLNLLWVLCQEIGEAHAHEGPGPGDVVVFDTLAHLHPRALLVSNEIMHLLNGGFADGALARWRTLHEISVVCRFITKHGRETAEAYRLSLCFTDYHLAGKYNDFARSVGREQISDEAMTALRSRRDASEETINHALRFDWDWACLALGKNRVRFSDLEIDVGMDYWRPWFSWASRGIHGGFVRPEKSLGMSEAESFFFQVGPSNSGLVMPIHMTAISLMEVCVCFLSFPEADFDRKMYTDTLGLLVDRIGAAAVQTQQRTLNEARSRRAQSTTTSSTLHPHPDPRYPS